mmetsp:Transcript_22817/g.65290  ORF Transcript_22817/g.65290 Transcript_22817/m.65290 type:complete len:267 (+) Transcript_22817:138-938(+)
MPASSSPWWRPPTAPTVPTSWSPSATAISPRARSLLCPYPSNPPAKASAWRCRKLWRSGTRLSGTGRPCSCLNTSPILAPATLRHHHHKEQRHLHQQRLVTTSMRRTGFCGQTRGAVGSGAPAAFVGMDRRTGSEEAPALPLTSVLLPRSPSPPCCPHALRPQLAHSRHSSQRLMPVRPCSHSTWTRPSRRTRKTTRRTSAKPCKRTRRQPLPLRQATRSWVHMRNLVKAAVQQQLLLVRVVLTVHLTTWRWALRVTTSLWCLGHQ